jgi:hypothetical protein
MPSEIELEKAALQQALLRQILPKNEVKTCTMGRKEWSR